LRSLETTVEKERTGSGGAAAYGVELYWLPLGAGGHFVRFNGRLYEFVASAVQHRAACDLYHSALQVRTPGGRFVIESAPIRPADGDDRGVVGEGPVGSRLLRRFRVFRYELRCWRDGYIPDAAEAVDSPVCLTSDPLLAERLLALTPRLPCPVWGRDELHAGEMWNSNSIVAWLLSLSGIDTSTINPPRGGRAPGWNAGLVVAQRELTPTAQQPLLEEAQAPSPVRG
jgi:hypothetical protein